jgi:hypothetical protein
LDAVRQEKHSFTIGDPYKVDIDIAFAENGNVTLTANNRTTNPYYCKYHQPVIAGQVLALPQEFKIPNGIIYNYNKSCGPEITSISLAPESET